MAVNLYNSLNNMSEQMSREEYETLKIRQMKSMSQLYQGDGDYQSNQAKQSGVQQAPPPAPPPKPLNTKLLLIKKG